MQESNEKSESLDQMQETEALLLAQLTSWEENIYMRGEKPLDKQVPKAKKEVMSQ